MSAVASGQAAKTVMDAFAAFALGVVLPTGMMTFGLMAFGVMSASGAFAVRAVAARTFAVGTVFTA